MLAAELCMEEYVPYSSGIRTQNAVSLSWHGLDPDDKETIMGRTWKRWA